MRRYTAIMIIVLTFPAVPFVADFIPPTLLLSWGSFGNANGEFNDPTGVATNRLGQIYVADRDNERIQLFDGSGKFLLKWGTPGELGGQFDRPRDVAVDSEGNIYVIEANFNYRLQKFDESGNFLRMWGWGVDDGSSAFQVCVAGCQEGLSGNGQGQFSSSSEALAVAPGGVYVVDGDRVQRFSKTGSFLGEWGRFGNGNGEFFDAQGIALDADGNVYVADRSLDRIQKFDATGNFLLVWGTSGSAGGQLDDPMELTVEKSRDIYIVEIGNDRVSWFVLANPCPPGTIQEVPGVCFALTFGSAGGADANFENPRGITLDGSGNIYVADTGQEQIEKFGGPFFRFFIGP